MRFISGAMIRRGGFWAGYNRLSEPARAVVIAPLMNRIRALLLRPYARALLTGQPPAPTPAGRHPPRRAGRRSTSDASWTAGCCWPGCPKGSLGDDATRLLGSIIVAHTWTAATARTHLPQDARRDAGLVIDECHNFLNLPYSIDDLLAEARGLRLSLTLAHQNLAQLPPELRAGVTTNARNKIIFTVGADDARDLARHTTPHLDDYDLAHLDAFHAAARLRRPRRPHPRLHPAHPTPTASPAAHDRATRPDLPPPADVTSTDARSTQTMTDPHPDPRSSPGRPRGSPRPQRAHRDPVAAGRSARFSDRHLAALATRLTPRDLWLLAMLWEHRVLTTHAIAHMAFSSDHRARRRLLQLHRWDVLERFAPRLPVGAAPMHYVLGPAGAAVLAAHHGLPLRALGYRRDEALAIAHHHTLAHTVAVNDLFAHLIHHTRPPPTPMSARVGAGRCGWTAGGPRPAAAATSTTSAPTPTPASPHPPGRARAGGGWCSSGSSSSTSPPAPSTSWPASSTATPSLAATTRPRPILIWLPTPAREAHARQRLTDAAAGRRARAGAGRDLDRRDRRAPPTRPRRPARQRIQDRARACRPGVATAHGPAQHRDGSTLPSSPGCGPPRPAHTLADEANTPGRDTDLDVELGRRTPTRAAPAPARSRRSARHASVDDPHGTHAGSRAARPPGHRRRARRRAPHHHPDRRPVRGERGRAGRHPPGLPAALPAGRHRLPRAGLDPARRHREGRVRPRPQPAPGVTNGQNAGRGGGYLRVGAGIEAREDRGRHATCR